MKALDFLYYRLYKLLLKTTLSDIAEHVAYMTLSFLICTNLAVIVKNLGINLLGMASAKVWASLVCGGMMVLFYFLFVRNKHYLRITEHYSNETKQQRIKGNLTLIAYVVASFAALILL